MERFAVVSVSKDGNSATIGNANNRDDAKALMTRDFLDNREQSPLVYLLVERDQMWLVQGHGFPPENKPTLRFTF